MSIIPPESTDSPTGPADAEQMLALLQGELAAERARAEGLERAMLSNRQIGVAIGILICQRHIDAGEAFTLLAKASQRSQTKLRDVAEHVVYTGTLDALPIRHHHRSLRNSEPG